MTHPQPRLLIVGDSISLGITEVLRAEVLSQLPEAYPDLLSSLLPAWEVTVDAAVNRTTTQAIPLLPDLLSAHRPDVVLLMLGGNDGDLDWRRFIMTKGGQARSMTSLDRFEANLEQLISLCDAAGAAAILADLPNCDIQRRATWISSKVGQDVNAMVESAGGQAETDRRIHTYIQTIESVAARSAVEVVRWGAPIANLPPERAFGPDFMHPAADSQRIIAHEVARAVTATTLRATNAPAKTAVSA
jgi:lysophospholipase L1-like esterase